MGARTAGGLVVREACARTPSTAVDACLLLRLRWVQQIVRDVEPDIDVEWLLLLLLLRGTDESDAHINDRGRGVGALSVSRAGIVRVEGA